MKRVLLAAIAGAVLVTPLAGSAHAASPKLLPQNKVHKICIEFPTGGTGTPDGYCITQELPI